VAVECLLGLAPAAPALLPLMLLMMAHSPATSASCNGGGLLLSPSAATATNQPSSCPTIPAPNPPSGPPGLPLPLPHPSQVAAASSATMILFTSASSFVIYLTFGLYQ
jgi:hypothetical protein